MRIVCVGGGPAGLYFAILMKQRDKNHDITVLERNPAGLTYGWGVVFWQDLLDALYDSDPVTAHDIDEHSFRWDGQLVQVEGKPAARLNGYGFSIGRRRLLDILAKRATDLGVHVDFEHEVEEPAELADADLIVACDGVNSRLRRLHADQLESGVAVGRNKYIWLGTSRVFDSFTFAFARTDAGWIWFHAYGYNSDSSTCIVECSPETWAALGFDSLDEAESMTLLEAIFEPHLDGHPLTSQPPDHGRALWRNFRTVTSRRWHLGNTVLMGDAAHTTHFTIGSGTRLAIEDAIGLAARLQEHEDIESALDAYEKERKAALLLPEREARHSAQWFENIPRYIDLETAQFASLLKQRRSVLLARISPLRYYQLYRATEEIAVLQRLWAWSSSTRRDRYVRRRG